MAEGPAVQTVATDVAVAVAVTAMVMTAGAFAATRRGVQRKTVAWRPVGQRQGHGCRCGQK
jgi:uncharacterized membrane protein YfcA